MEVLNVWVLITFVSIVQSVFSFTSLDRMRVVYERQLIDFVWPSAEARRNALSDGSFIPINVTISGIKVWGNRVFLTVPKWKYGVPLTLASLPFSKLSHGAPLEAFPSWEMQKVGDCNMLQYAQSMEIDTRGKMWIIDTGRTVPLDGSPLIPPFCPPKLIVLDIEAVYRRKTNYLLKSYNFPAEIADPLTCFLNDLVLDLPNGFLYISDTGADPGIIVYDVKNNKSWKIRDEKTMKSDPNFPPLTIDGVNVDIRGLGIDGIALSPVEKNRVLYYCPIASREFYSIPTSALKENADISSFIQYHGQKTSFSDGLVMDNRRNLYFGINEFNGVGIWNPKDGNISSAKIFAMNNITLGWADTFAIDNNGNLWVVANRVHDYLANNVYENRINYRILMAPLGTRSYMYPSFN